MSDFVKAGFLALVLVSPGAFAAPAAEPEVRFLAGASLSLDGANLEDYLEAPITGANADYQGGGVGAELDAGLALGPYVQLRLGHRWFGEQEADVFNGNILVSKQTLEASGKYFAADMMVPVVDDVAVGITLGSLEWHAELEGRESGGVSQARESGSDLFAGVRGQVRLNEYLWLTTFATRYDLDTGGEEDLEYGVLGAGIQARF